MSVGLRGSTSAFLHESAARTLPEFCRAVSTPCRQVLSGSDDELRLGFKGKMQSSAKERRALSWRAACCQASQN